MTGSLEDTIAEAAHVWMYGDNGTRYTRRETEAMADAIAEVLRVAGVVPPEPAGHDSLRQAARSFVVFVDSYGPESNLVREHRALYDILDSYANDMRAAVAAVDGEAPAT